METKKILIKDSKVFNDTIKSFLKRFSNMDRSILLKIGEDGISSTMTTSDKALVKYSSIDIDDNIEFLSDFSDQVYIPLLTAQKLNNVLDFYSGELKINIATNIKDNITVATQLKFIGGNLKMELPCSVIDTFHISLKVTDELLSKISDTTTSLYDMELDSKEVDNIKKLADNNTTEKLHFKTENGIINFEGDNFALKMKEGVSGDNDYTCPKRAFKVLDTNEYSFFIMNEKSIFKANDGKGILIISKYIESNIVS